MPRARRYARRLLVLGLYTSAAVVLYLIVAPLLPQRGDGATAGAAATARPKSVPAMIPTWAWTLSAWQAAPAADRGRRPKAAPRTVPKWYWDWRSWRAQSGADAS